MSNLKEIGAWLLISLAIALGSIQILSIADASLGYQDLVCQEGGC